MRVAFYVVGNIAGFLSVLLGLWALSPVAVAIGVTASACMILLDGAQRRQEQLDSIQKDLQAIRREMATIRSTMEPEGEPRIREESVDEIAMMSFLTDDTRSDL